AVDRTAVVCGFVYVSRVSRIVGECDCFVDLWFVSFQNIAPLCGDVSSRIPEFWLRLPIVSQHAKERIAQSVALRSARKTKDPELQLQTSLQRKQLMVHK